MQIDSSRIKKLSAEEKERQKREGLCFYCGKKDHQASNHHKHVRSKPQKFRFIAMILEEKLGDLEIDDI